MWQNNSLSNRWILCVLWNRMVCTEFKERRRLRVIYFNARNLARCPLFHYWTRLRGVQSVSERVQRTFEIPSAFNTIRKIHSSIDLCLDSRKYHHICYPLKSIRRDTSPWEMQTDLARVCGVSCILPILFFFFCSVLTLRLPRFLSLLFSRPNRLGNARAVISRANLTLHATRWMRLV